MDNFKISYIVQLSTYTCARGRRGRNRVIVGFTTTYAINAYHHWCCDFKSWSKYKINNYCLLIL